VIARLVEEMLDETTPNASFCLAAGYALTRGVNRSRILSCQRADFDLVHDIQLTSTPSDCPEVDPSETPDWTTG
jgi:hypothetical protein